MKGMVFTEFIEFAKQKFSCEACDKMLDKSKLDSKGLYLQTKDYNFEELLILLTNLEQIVNVPLSEIIESFGEYLFSKLLVMYPERVQKFSSSFDFIKNIEYIIEDGALNFHPDGRFPSFELINETENELQIKYTSDKPLMELIRGLMTSCSKYYNENIDISFKAAKEGEVFQAIFKIKKIED